MNTSKCDKLFKDNLNKLILEGTYDINPRPHYADGTPSHSKFITQVFEEYDYSKGELPTTTLRNIAVKMGIKEIQWIYQAQSNSLNVAHDMGIRWWDDWNIGDNTIGQRYGATVKKHGIIENLLQGLETNPFGRRHIINLWQCEDLKTKGLEPCAFQSLYSVRKVEDTYYLDATLTQRSSDVLMANHINKMQYLALALMLCSHLRYTTKQNWQVGKFVHFVQNYHVYDRHEEGLKELMSREPIEDNTQVFALNVDKNFYDIVLEDFEIKLPNHGKLQIPLELAI